MRARERRRVKNVRGRQQRKGTVAQAGARGNGNKSGTVTYAHENEAAKKRNVRSQESASGKQGEQRTMRMRSTKQLIQVL